MTKLINLRKLTHSNVLLLEPNCIIVGGVEFVLPGSGIKCSRLIVSVAYRGDGFIISDCGTDEVLIQTGRTVSYTDISFDNESKWHMMTVKFQGVEVGLYSFSTLVLWRRFSTYPQARLSPIRLSRFTSSAKTSVRLTASLCMPT